MKKQKKTWWLSSKKCLRANAVLLIFLISIKSSLGSTPSVSNPSPKQLQSEIHKNPSSGMAGFEKLIQSWEKRFGSQAALPLLTLARDSNTDENERYIALMGAAKLGGQPLLPEINSFLSDRSWMLRSAALRILAALGSPESGLAALPLLRDKALVVRAEAVETVRTLRPSGAALALLEALENPENYHHGKALWVPQKALQALTVLNASEVIPEIGRFLKSKRTQSDPELRSLTQKTLLALESRQN
ncbi:MAG: HEAT repeat domain-containing protein [Bdellovibrio sp.]|nr:HEAT repeat domain-containing protein [Bdellovibrio sp.]